jgi:hypothetical protein
LERKKIRCSELNRKIVSHMEEPKEDFLALKIWIYTSKLGIYALWYAS